MDRQAGEDGNRAHQVTRRGVLKTGLVSRLGLSAVSLSAVATPTPSAAKAVYGGHANILTRARLLQP